MLASILKNNNVVVFGTPDCPFCTRCNALFADFGVDVLNVNILDPENRTAYDEVIAATQHETIPAVYVRGEFIGGCVDTCAMADSGELQCKMQLPSFHLHRSNRPPPTSLSLFQFGPIAERWTAQATGVQVFVVSVILIVFREEDWAHWVAFGGFLDFVVRFVFGGTASCQGSVAALLTSWLKPVIIAGPPKQFAAFCGVFFYGLAAALMLLGSGDTVTIGGSIVLAIVGACAFLEGFFNFCMGCFFFGLGVRIGFVPKSVYQSYTDTAAMFNYTITDFRTKLGMRDFGKVSVGDIPAEDPDLMGWRRQIGTEYVPIPVEVNQVIKVGTAKTLLDVPYKFPKTDDTQRESWSAAYIQFEDFGMPLGLGGLAAAFKAIRDTDDVHHSVWQTIALIAACIHCLMLLALLFKCLRYPTKIYNDMMHPMKRHALSAIILCNLLFAFLMEGFDWKFQHFIWWTAAPSSLVHLIFMLFVWIKNRHSSEHINPGMIFPVATSLFASIVAHTMVDFGEAAQWFFGVGFLFFIITLVATFSHGVTYHWSDDRMRPMVALWMGGCFIIQLAFQTISGGYRAAEFDLFSMTFFASGCILFLVCVLLAYPGRWLLRGRFEMANWAIAFPLDIFAMSATQYRLVYGHTFSKFILYMAFVFAVWANFTMLCHTLTNFFGGRWPRPPQKWGPLSFNKLQHEAMRVMIAKMIAEVDANDDEGHLHIPSPNMEPAAEPVDANSKFDSSMCRLRELWGEYCLLTGGHADTEDNVYFKELKAFNAEQLRQSETQHRDLHVSMDAANASFASRDFPTAMKYIKEHGIAMLDHMQWEEDHVQSIVRKQLNLGIHFKIVTKSWEAIPLEHWQQTFPTVVRHLPMHGQRLKYIKAFTWVMPERAQEIGRWVYKGLGEDPMGELKWAMLVNDLPEIGLRGTLDYSKVL